MGLLGANCNKLREMRQLNYTSVLLMSASVDRYLSALGVLVLIGALGAVSAAGCRRKDAAGPPVATATVTLNRDRAALGSPIEIVYRFVVSGEARFDQDYWVMLHVVDSDDQLIWTDDHQPPVPTTQWKAGQTVEYTRTIFIPIYPYVGETTLQLGLYSRATQKRLPLEGQDMGQRAYKVGKLLLQPQTESVLIVTKDGWNSTEVAERNPSVTWSWTKKHATLSFKNPKTDSIFYLDLDNPDGVFNEPQQVRVSMGGAMLDDFQVKPRTAVLRKIPIKTAQLGTDTMSELQISVDKTFVPAVLTNGRSRDSRELGVRVFHTYVQPVK
jgi:hypothetical protein